MECDVGGGSKGALGATDGKPKPTRMYLRRPPEDHPQQRIPIASGWKCEEFMRTKN